MQTPFMRRAYDLQFPENGRTIEKSRWKMNIENEKEPEFNQKKNRNVYFCVAYMFFPTSTRRVINNI